MSRTPMLAALLLAALWLAPAAARADDPGEAETVEVPHARVLHPVPPGDIGDTPYTGVSAAQDWANRRPWSYGTRQLYPLTRGMADAGIPAPARWALYPFTVVFDTGNLAFSALGGLYGN